MQTIILILKGCLFGVANIIPGVSGGTMALITGVFDKLLASINNLFKQFKKSILFLLPYVIGIAIGIVVGGLVIKSWKNAYPVSLEALFIGLIAGGIPFLAKGIKKTDLKPINISSFIIAGAIVIGLMILSSFLPDSKEALQGYDYLLLFLCGILSAIAMIVPGISGMMFFMLFGYYDLLMNTVSSLFDMSLLLNNILILLPIGLGVLVGLFTSAKLFAKILEKFPVASLFAILGFVFTSLIVIINEMVQANITSSDYQTSIPEIIISIGLVVLGFFITFFISKHSNKDKEQDVEEKLDLSND